MKRFMLGVLAMALCGVVAAADEPKDCGCGHTHWWLEAHPAWYAGAALGQTTFDGLPNFDDGSLSSEQEDDSDLGFRAFVGAGIGRYVAVELGYADFGETSSRAQSDGSGGSLAAGPYRDSLAVDGYDLALVGKLPLNADWGLFGKVARLKWDSSYEVSGNFQCCGPSSAKLDDDGYDTTFGVGVQYEGLRPVRFAVVYDAASVALPFFDEDADITSIGLSVAYGFE
jgi:OmpA-like transmembrane domain